jgi:hypothetical protein
LPRSGLLDGRESQRQVVEAVEMPEQHFLMVVDHA